MHKSSLAIELSHRIRRNKRMKYSSCFCEIFLLYFLQGSPRNSLLFMIWMQIWPFSSILGAGSYQRSDNRQNKKSQGKTSNISKKCKIATIFYRNEQIAAEKAPIFHFLAGGEIQRTRTERKYANSRRIKARRKFIAA